VDPQPRSGVRPKKSARDRLIRLAAQNPTWVLGFQDETWWSRVSPPQGSAWAEEKQPLRVVEQSVPNDEKEAISCYGMLLRCPGDSAWTEQMWVRFVQERPVSALTIEFLEWSCRKLQGQGKRALLLIWDNAGWHLSHEVRNWIRAHNWSVRKSGKGVRIVACFLPSKSPWLNPIEPKWRHAKRAVAEPDGLLSFEELERRVCARFACDPEPHLSLAEKAA
jgi:transposase